MQREGPLDFPRALLAEIVVGEIDGDGAAIEFYGDFGGGAAAAEGVQDYLWNYFGACELKRTLAVPAYPKRNIVFPQCGHGCVLILFAFGILSWSRFNITCKFTSRLSAFNPFK